MRLTSIAILSALLAACGPDDNEPEPKQSSVDYEKLEIAANSDAGLKLVNDDELGQHIKNGIRLSLKSGSNAYLKDFDFALEGGAPTSDNSGGEVAAPSQGKGGESDGSGSDGFSGTNVHVDGVDEADVAKYDGKHWFVASSPLVDDFLIDNQTPGFHIVATDPSTPNAEILARVSLDDKEQSWGAVNEMYLVQKDNETSHVATVRSQWGNVRPFLPGILVRGGAEFVDLPVMRGTTVDVAVEPSARAQTGVRTNLRIADGDILPYVDPVNSQVRLQLTNVETANAPKTDWELKIDGSLIDSRKVGNILYLVTRFDPWVEGLFFDYGDDGTRTKNEAELAQVPPEKLLPHYYIGNETLPLSDGCYIQQNATVNHGYASLVSITAINLETQALVSSQCVNGAVEALSMSTDSLYLTGTVYDEASPSGDTVIHKFNLADSGPEYVATGSAVGSLGWNSDIAFRMHEQGDTFRIVTSHWESEGPVHRLSILEEQDGKLVTLSTLPNNQRPEPIGKPREDIYSVRFEQNKAYIVTFERTDPLYTIDLTDPLDPFIAGELEIPGFATYMHPIEGDYLFTLGRDADENGRVKGMKAELIYVGNGIPEVVNTLYFEGQSTNSEALHNLKAMSFKHDTSRTRITFPITKYTENYEWEFSGLQMLEITPLDALRSEGGTSTSLPQLLNAGTIISQRPNDTNYPKNSGVNRSIIHDNAVFFASNNEYWAAQWSNPEAAIGPIREEPVVCIAIAPPPALIVNLKVAEGTNGDPCDTQVIVFNHTNGTEDIFTPSKTNGACSVEVFGPAGEYTILTELDRYQGQKNWAIVYRDQCQVITTEVNVTLSEYQCVPDWKPEIVAYVELVDVVDGVSACDAEVIANVNGERITLTPEFIEVESGSDSVSSSSSSSGSDGASSEDIATKPADPFYPTTRTQCRFSAEYEAVDAEVTFNASLPGYIATQPQGSTVRINNQQCFEREVYGNLALTPER